MWNGCVNGILVLGRCILCLRLTVSIVTLYQCLFYYGSLYFLNSFSGTSTDPISHVIPDQR